MGKRSEKNGGRRHKVVLRVRTQTAVFLITTKESECSFRIRNKGLDSFVFFCVFVHFVEVICSNFNFEQQNVQRANGLREKLRKDFFQLSYRCVIAQFIFFSMLCVYVL